MHLHSQLTVVLIAIMMLSLLWGSSFIAIKIIVDEVQPLASFGMRFFIAGLLLVAAHYILIHTIHRRPYKKAYQNIQIKNRQYWKSWLLAALFFIVGGQGILALGAQYLSSGAAALINSTIPIWVAIFMLLFLGKKPTRLSIAGIAAGFIGLIILVLPALETEESDWIGIVLLIISSISWAVGSLFSTPVHYAGTERAILLPTGMFMALGGLILLAIWAVTGTNEISTLNTLFSAENNLLVSFLFLTLVCTAVGYAIFYWLLESTTPSLANTFAYIVPVIAVFLGWVILGESISSQTIIATVVISVGVAMMIISPSSKKTNK
ncbi:MAG: DMT family transporter [Nitrososphaeraceae archaeon]